MKSVIACGMACLLAAPAGAGLAHRYSFESDVSDSVGGADGTVVDAGTTSNAAFAGGQLDLSANTGELSNEITEDAYVDLPNGTVSAAAAGGVTGSGVSGAVSFEWWATVAETNTWQRLGDFGTSDGGEDASTSGENSDYLLITPNSGRFGNGLEMTNHPASNADEPNAGIDGPFPTGEEQHVVAVYNHNENQGGATNGTMRLFLNGAEVASGEIHADMDISAMDDNNNWLGRSQWPDPVFDGSYNEFRIYDHALGAGQVERNFGAGPDQLGANIPEPASIALLALAGAAALGVRRRLRA